MFGRYGAKKKKLIQNFKITDPNQNIQNILCIFKTFKTSYTVSHISFWIKVID